MNWILVGITVLVIVALLVDAARRMRRRKTPVAAPLPPRKARAEEPDFNPELPSGKARVIRREPSLSAANPGDTQPQPAVSVAGSRESVAPDVVVKKIEQVDMFGDVEIPAGQPAAAREIRERGELPRREPASGGSSRNHGAGTSSAGAPRSGRTEKTEQQQKQAPDEVIVVHVMGGAARLDGRKLLQSVLDCGLRFGEYNIFHRYESGAHDAAAMFSMASAVEPGVFDLDAMEGQTFVGISFFLMLPGPANSRQALDTMIEAARRVAKDVNGELHDQQHSVLTAQTVEHLRQRVMEYERRRLAQQRVNS